MAITVTRKDNRSADQLQVEFNRKTTRFVKKLRKSRYNAKAPAQLKKKTAAVISAAYRAEKEKRKHYE
jgi:hypothetical protein